LARNRARGRRAAAPDQPSSAPGPGPGPRASLASATLPRVWQGLGYRPLTDPAPARPLFDFAAVPFPEGPVFAWGAFTAAGGEGLVGAIVGEPRERDTMLHGPVVIAGNDPLETAAQLVVAALDHAVAAGATTVFARPLGLDRVWVRFGFIPVPESTLPATLAGRPGVGLYAWRGGSALWGFRDSIAD
jgi:hypothetical protein